MKTFLRLFILCAFSLAPFNSEVLAQDAPQLSLEMKPGRRLLVRWQASAGTTRLVWTDALGQPTAWQPLAGVAPMGGDLWQAEFHAVIPRAFFTLHPPALPVPPPHVRLVLAGDHFQLEWDSTSDAAGYVVYVGVDPSVGPGNSILQLAVPAANALEITGLTAGQTYFISIAATNAAGEGTLAPAVNGVFGPKGVLAGTGVQSFLLGTGETFDVLAEGATINAVSLSNPVAQPLSTIADPNGHFRFPNLPVGDYLIGYVFQGQAGFLPTPVTVGESGAAVMPLIIPSGPQPPPPGATLVGTLTLSDGHPARNDIDEFDIHIQAELRAVLATGGARLVHPDRNGAWAITDLTPSDYPISLVMDYPGLQQRVVPVPAPPLELVRIDLVFPEILPSVKGMTIFQNGQEVQTIARGVPVTVVGEFENPDGLPLEPRWIAEFNGQQQLATGSSATFIFNQPSGPPGPGLGDPQDGGLVLVRPIPSGISLVGPPKGWQLDGDVLGVGCWSGLVGQWSPFGPNIINPVHPSTVTVKHAGLLSPSSTTPINTNAGGYFELPVDPTTVPPYLIRVDKPGFMRFLWPFEQRLPNEGTYCVTAAIGSIQSQHPSGPRIFTHPLGGRITIPWGEVLDPFNQPWFGDIFVTMTTFDPFVRSPLPPGAEVRGANLRNGISAYGAVWFDITDQSGVPLVPTAACTLTLPVPVSVTYPVMFGYHQVENTGYFERWANSPSIYATKTGPGQYTVTLGTKGLFLVGFDSSLIQIVIVPDRTLGYPFDILVNNTIFPVTVQGFNQLSTGRLFVPITAGAILGTVLNVLDPRQAPGLRYANPTSTNLYVAPMQKTRVIAKNITPFAPVPPLPLIASTAAYVSLNDSVPGLAGVSPTSAALNGAAHFFARGGGNTAAAAADYYTRINAPTTLAQWRSINGFPARFGGPLNASADDYATAYYYNLGDLGFARAQSMLIRFSSIDGGYDTAYQVTNYRTIEDAICGRGAIATVCMDFSKRTDPGAQTATRYTRFYVYGSNGALLNEADLDGAGLKGVPNLCVQCHGGKFWDTSDLNRTTNLGSRFLPFDLESFTYHPKFGVQQAELGRMNKGVLLTGPTAATADLIAGWYGNPNPLANLSAFNQNYVPSAGTLSWAGNASLYTDVFKPGCRVCHNSRETTGYAQFASFANFQGLSFGNYPVGSSLQMPHARRPWSILWGSRGAVNLGQPVPNMPTILQTFGGTTYR